MDYKNKIDTKDEILKMQCQKNKESEITNVRPLSFPFTYEKVSKKDLKKLEKNHKKSWD